MKNLLTDDNAKNIMLGAMVVVGAVGASGGLAFETATCASTLAKLMHCKNDMNYDPLIKEAILTLATSMVFLPLILVMSSGARSNSMALYSALGFVVAESAIILNTLNEMGLGECIAEKWSSPTP